MLSPVTISAELDVIAKRLEYLNAAIEENVVALTSSGDPGAACRALFQLDSGYEVADKSRKQLHAKIEYISRSVVPEVFGASDTRTLTLSDIRRRFTVTQRVSASIVDRDAAFNFLRENGGGDLIQEAVNVARLSLFIKELLIETQKSPPEEAIKMSTLQYTSITAVK